MFNYKKIFITTIATSLLLATFYEFQSKGWSIRGFDINSLIIILVSFGISAFFGFLLTLFFDDKTLFRKVFSISQSIFIILFIYANLDRAQNIRNSCQKSNEALFHNDHSFNDSILSLAIKFNKRQLSKPTKYKIWTLGYKKVESEKTYYIDQFYTIGHKPKRNNLNFSRTLVDSSCFSKIILKENLKNFNLKEATDKLYDSTFSYIHLYESRVSFRDLFK